MCILQAPPCILFVLMVCVWFSSEREMQPLHLEWWMRKFIKINCAHICMCVKGLWEAWSSLRKGKRTILMCDNWKYASIFTYPNTNTHISNECLLLRAQLSAALCSGWSSWQTGPPLMWCPDPQYQVCATARKKKVKKIIMDSTKAKQIYKDASAAHPVFIHGGEDCVSDQTRIVV